MNINNSGHMTKMAATPIYDENLYKFSSTEPKGLGSWIDLETSLLGL